MQILKSKDWYKVIFVEYLGYFNFLETFHETISRNSRLSFVSKAYTLYGSWNSNARYIQVPSISVVIRYSKNVKYLVSLPRL